MIFLLIGQLSLLAMYHTFFSNKKTTACAVVFIGKLPAIKKHIEFNQLNSTRFNTSKKYNSRKTMAKAAYLCQEFEGVHNHMY